MALYSVPVILHSDDGICDAYVCGWGKRSQPLAGGLKPQILLSSTLRNVMWKVADDTGE